MANDIKKLDDIISDELEALCAKRKKSNPDDGYQNPNNLFGIALSGGGIRSATINLGFLEVLNRCGILKLADYISTVSGGGYTGGYIHSKMRANTSSSNPFNLLFKDNDLYHIKEYGYYLAPIKGWQWFNKCKLVASYIAGLFMNLIWVFALLLLCYFLLQDIGNLDILKNITSSLGESLLAATLTVLGFHFIFHGLRFLRLWSSDVLNTIETLLFMLLLLYFAGQATHVDYGITTALGNLKDTINAECCNTFIILLRSINQSINQGADTIITFLCLGSFAHSIKALLFLALIGLFANPNILTLHRFYRDRLADAYMNLAGTNNASLKLHELNEGTTSQEWGCAPYPLINACLNLSGENDPSFVGTKTCDYFLLSPLYCGSLLTGYVSTQSPGYRSMNLSKAVAISGAAISSQMGQKSNKALAFLVTLLNVRLGYWALNPKALLPAFSSIITWWPFYQVMELFSKTTTLRERVYLSDGGHIENLGVYELLRRKCRLIIAFDASADPDFTFEDLRNLVIRARNELCLDISFKNKPEETIKPAPSSGFSKEHFVVAEIKELKKEDKEQSTHPEPEFYTGVLIYIKSSLKAQDECKSVQSDSFLYKTYHPSFPQESTAEQFFDANQWQAYYRLGQFIAGDLLGVKAYNSDTLTPESVGISTIDDLIKKFVIA